MKTAIATDSLTDEAEREEWKALVMESFAGEEIHYDPLTCSIGCHVGPRRVRPGRQPQGGLNIREKRTK